MGIQRIAQHLNETKCHLLEALIKTLVGQHQRVATLVALVVLDCASYPALQVFIVPGLAEIRVNQSGIQRFNERFDVHVAGQ
jgi:hypothetical protein